MPLLLLAHAGDGALVADLRHTILGALARHCPGQYAVDVWTDREPLQVNIIHADVAGGRWTTTGRLARATARHPAARARWLAALVAHVAQQRRLLRMA